MIIALLLFLLLWIAKIVGVCSLAGGRWALALVFELSFLIVSILYNFVEKERTNRSKK